MDRISDLPDGIITHILSFLPTEEAASASLLSRRWRDMFALSPNLSFSYTLSNRHTQKDFIDFVDRVLAVSGNSAIRRFKLCCPFGVSPTHTNRWIRNVLSRGGAISHLHILANNLFEDSLLFHILACKTLVSLILASRLKFQMLPESVSLPPLKPLHPESVSLPALKSLLLFRVKFCNLGEFEKLISACPLLEELTMDRIDWNWSGGLSVPYLKRLTIRCLSEELRSMSFDLPNLVYFDYSDFVQLHYPVVNLASLVEAKLKISMRDGDFNIYDPLSLIQGLKNVKILNLACSQTVKIFEYFSEAMPVFENLIHLTITTNVHQGIGVSCLSSLLKKFPNVQTLVIKGLLFDDDNFCGCTSRCSCLVSCAVKVLEVTEYKGSMKERGLMKRFLEELSCLELVKIRIKTKDDQVRLRVTKNLLRLPITSSKCKIKIKSVVT